MKRSRCHRLRRSRTPAETGLRKVAIGVVVLEEVVLLTLTEVAIAETLIPLIDRMSDVEDGLIRSIDLDPEEEVPMVVIAPDLDVWMIASTVVLPMHRDLVDLDLIADQEMVGGLIWGAGVEVVRPLVGEVTTGIDEDHSHLDTMLTEGRIQGTAAARHLQCMTVTAIVNALQRGGEGEGVQWMWFEG